MTAVSFGKGWLRETHVGRTQREVSSIRRGTDARRDALA